MKFRILFKCSCERRLIAASESATVESKQADQWRRTGAVTQALSLTQLKGTLAGDVAYRLGQVRQQLGFVAPLAPTDCSEVERWLSPTARALFQTMSLADQQHSLRVCRGLQARGCTEPDMLAAALLHDVGKAQGRVPFWTRPVIVLSKRLWPEGLKRATLPPDQLDRDPVPGWRRALSYAWWHTEVGAVLAERAGISAWSILYIRTHHQPQGPAAELHAVDEVS
ncbi:MAG: hypothetical protein NVSMB44_24290 [Ktedonobacteraceae bacterium]